MWHCVKRPGRFAVVTNQTVRFLHAGNACASQRAQDNVLEYKLLSLTYKVLTTSQPDYLHNLISVQSSGRTRSSSVVTLARPSVSSSLQITNRSFRYASPIALSHMHHLTFGINSLFHSVNLIVFTLLLVHLILRMSPHHSHHLRSHHLSRPPPFTPDLKLISFTNPFLHSHSYSFRTDFMDLSLYCIKGALALVVLVSFSGYVC